MNDNSVHPGFAVVRNQATCITGHAQYSATQPIKVSGSVGDELDSLQKAVAALHMAFDEHASRIGEVLNPCGDATCNSDKVPVPPQPVRSEVSQRIASIRTDVDRVAEQLRVLTQRVSL